MKTVEVSLASAESGSQKATAAVLLQPHASAGRAPSATGEGGRLRGAYAAFSLTTLIELIISSFMARSTVTHSSLPSLNWS